VGNTGGGGFRLRGVGRHTCAARVKVRVRVNPEEVGLGKEKESWDTSGEYRRGWFHA